MDYPLVALKIKIRWVTPYKNNCGLVLNKGYCVFANSDFPPENPRIQTRNYSYKR